MRTNEGWNENQRTKIRERKNENEMEGWNENERGLREITKTVLAFRHVTQFRVTHSLGCHIGHLSCFPDEETSVSSKVTCLGAVTTLLSQHQAASCFGYKPPRIFPSMSFCVESSVCL